MAIVNEQENFITQSVSQRYAKAVTTGEKRNEDLFDDLRRDYPAQGDAVGLAARMQQIAEAAERGHG